MFKAFFSLHFKAQRLPNTVLISALYFVHTSHPGTRIVICSELPKLPQLFQFVNLLYTLNSRRVGGARQLLKWKCILTRTSIYL